MIQPLDRVLVRLALLFSAGLLVAGCQGETQLKVVAGVDACHHCNMLIDQTNQACGYIKRGTLVPFDSPGCLLASYERLRTGGGGVPKEVFFVDYRDGSWHSAESTAFLLTEQIPTVMNSGVICFASVRAAEETKTYDSERITDWLGYRTARGIPDREVAVILSPHGTVPEVVDVSKGELILWRVKATGLEKDMKVAVQGYPEVGTIVIPAGGEEVSFRLMAVRPGAGFPIIEAESGEALGRMRVSGAHTLEEEEM